MNEEYDEFDDETDDDSDNSLSVDGNAGASKRDLRDTNRILSELIAKSRHVITSDITNGKPVPPALPPHKPRGANTIRIDINNIQTLDDGSHVIHMGDAEIWDGADLALLRETFVYLFQNVKSRSFGVNMPYVKYVPSGFFGTLYDWYQMGVEIRLYAPQSQITGMRWFQEYFSQAGESAYRMHS